jgi:hypothetical protein
MLSSHEKGLHLLTLRQQYADNDLDTERTQQTMPLQASLSPRRSRLTPLFICSCFAILLISFVALVILLREGHLQHGSTGVNPNKPFQPSSTGFLVHLPLFGSSNLPSAAAASDAQKSSSNIASPNPQAALGRLEMQQSKAHARLCAEHEEGQRLRAAQAAATTSPALSPLALASRPASRRLLCYVPRAETTFPVAGEWASLSKGGNAMLHFGILMYLLAGWAVLWCNYVAPLGRYIALQFDLATLLACAGCLPNLAINFFSVYWTHRDFGTATVLGSSLFNTFVIPVTLYFALPHRWYRVFWWRATRDLVFFVVSVLVMVASTITGQEISLFDCCVLLVMLAVYLYVLFRDNEIYLLLGRALYKASKKALKDRALNKQATGIRRFLASRAFNHFISVCIITNIALVIWETASVESVRTLAACGQEELAQPFGSQLFTDSQALHSFVCPASVSVMVLVDRFCELRGVRHLLVGVSAETLRLRHPGLLERSPRLFRRYPCHSHPL